MNEEICDLIENDKDLLRAREFAREFDYANMNITLIDYYEKQGKTISEINNLLKYTNPIFAQIHLEYFEASEKFIPQKINSMQNKLQILKEHIKNRDLENLTIYIANEIAPIHKELLDINTHIFNYVTFVNNNPAISENNSIKKE
ncbi:hypothetical protein K9L97_01030 [Candidatus Woesearchaeota archaeon]|nr:hypothetical protein [Candidatus Woesearchaeota archaeon]